MSRKIKLTEARKMFGGWLAVFDTAVRQLGESRKAGAIKVKKIIKRFKKRSYPYHAAKMGELLGDYTDWLKRHEEDIESNHRLKKMALKEMAAIARQWQDKEMWRMIDEVALKDSRWRKRLPPFKR